MSVTQLSIVHALEYCNRVFLWPLDTTFLSLVFVVHCIKMKYVEYGIEAASSQGDKKRLFMYLF